MNDEFPLDASVRLIAFPCYLVRNVSGKGFACHELAEGGYAVVLLTDVDSLDRYRQEIGFPDRAAVRLETAEELLIALQAIPSAITQICFDLCRRSSEQKPQEVRLWEIGQLRRDLAQGIGRGQGGG